MKTILTATIWFDTLNYTGEVNIKCMPADFIICNTDGANCQDDLSPEGPDACAVVNRVRDKSDGKIASL